MHDTLRFWLDRGVDGFRADVVHLIGKGDDVDVLTDAEATTRSSRSTARWATSCCSGCARCSTLPAAAR